jgi:hypothetical protein
MLYSEALRIVNTAHTAAVSFFSKDGGAGWVACLKKKYSDMSLPRPTGRVHPQFSEKTNFGTFWAEIASPPDGVIGTKENMNVDDMQDLSGESGSRGQGGDEALVSAAASGSYRPKKRKKAKHRFPLDPHFIGFENKDLRTCFAIVVVQLVLAIPEVRHFS